MNRRRWLRSTVGGAALAWAPWGAAQTNPAPADRIRIGVIGVAGRGVPNIDGVAHENIIALCDVDTERAAPLRKRFPSAQFYTDYRRLLDNKDIQAVVIATPDHHHAFAALPALQTGKHVYCEKPLAHSVYEVRRMMEAASRAKVATQMGTQIHAGENYRRVVEIIQAGLIGTVRRVHVWCERRADPGVRAQGNPMPPAHLDYDLWLGPAPARPYHASHLHFNWRWWWDFGGGVLADMACHFMDLPHWALGLRQPRTIAAQGHVTYKGDNEMPDLMQVEFEYPARGTAPPVHLTWYHGVRGPDLEGKRTFAGFNSGVLFEGDKGQLVANYNNYRLLPEEQYRDVQLPKPTLPRSIGHHREWLAAIRDGGETTCNFQYSGALTETVLLGNVSYRAGAKLEYDAASGQVTNHRDAERFLRRDYRRGWTL
jgi:predicted dehydrogenase